MAKLQHYFERFLGNCVSRSFRRERPLVIGVAGSVGKTSTKTAIGIALGAHEAGTGVVMTEKNYNNELGVPLVVFGCDMPHRSPVLWIQLLGKAFLTSIGLLKLRARVFVLELGTDKPGDLDYLINMTHPTIGVLTAIGIEHTEFFGSIEGVEREEMTLIRRLPADGIAVVNVDDRRIQNAIASLPVRQVGFGTGDTAMAQVFETRIEVDSEKPESSGLFVDISVFGKTRPLRLTGTVGRPQAYAVAAAIACVISIDADLKTAIRRLEEQFHGMPGRMSLIEGIKHSWLIDDSYNSSPLAVASALRDLASFPVVEGARRIAALGDMRELGALTEDAHREEGLLAAEVGVDMLVVCGTLAHVVARAAKEGGMPDEHIFTFANSAEVGLFIQERMKKGDVILIKGSQNTVFMERVTKELMAHPEEAGQLLVRQSAEWEEQRRLT